MGRILFPLWQKIKRHKYAVVIFLIVLIDGFLDENSFFVRYQRQKQFDAINMQIRQYKHEYQNVDKELNLLNKSKAEVERLARERYYMRRPNEDVFVLVSQSEFAEDEVEEDSVEVVQTP